MSGYTVDDLRRKLERELAPHSITIGLIVDAAGYVTIEAQRINGTAKQHRFTLSTPTMTSAVIEVFAKQVREWFEWWH